MKPLTVVFFSNFVDERTRTERNITTDSPAASRKVLNACRALQAGGARPIILSMGRGRALGGRVRQGWVVRRIDRVPVVYAPYYHRKWLSEVVSLAAPAFFILKRRKYRRALLLLYNRLVFGLPPLLAARLVGWPTVFDLEDGEFSHGSNNASKRLSTLVRFGRRLTMGLYDRHCQRAILAATALESLTSVRPTLPYYGSIEPEEYRARAPEEKLRIVYTGTISPLTGSTVLTQALTYLIKKHPSLTTSFALHVTGGGEGLAELEHLAETCSDLELIVHGRLSLNDYRALLARAHVGLSLKKVGEDYADTTFPSKTVEYSAAGLHVISTDISDVRRVLGPMGTYLSSNCPRELAAAIAEAVALGPAGLEMPSRRLQEHVSYSLSFKKTGLELNQFLEGTFRREF